MEVYGLQSIGKVAANLHFDEWMVFVKGNMTHITVVSETDDELDSRITIR